MKEEVMTSSNFLIITSFLIIFISIFFIYRVVTRKKDIVPITETSIEMSYGDKKIYLDTNHEYEEGDRIKIVSFYDNNISLEGYITNVEEKNLTFNADTVKNFNITASSVNKYKKWYVYLIRKKSSILFEGEKGEKGDQGNKGDTGGISTFDGYDIFVIAGEENAVGWNTGGRDVYIDYEDPRIMQWGASSTYLNKIVIARDPLLYPDADQTVNTDSVGFAITFGKKYIENIAYNRKVLFIPLAVKDSSLVHGTAQWAYGNAYYNNMITKANAAIASNEGNLFKGIFWCHGETDASNDITQNNYSAAIDDFVDGYRADITGASTSAFVVICMVPEWISANSETTSAVAINASHEDTHHRKYYVNFTSGPYDSYSGMDYTIAGQRSIGNLSYIAYIDALKDPEGKVLWPSFSPDHGSYYGSRQVVLASTTPGATIYYTTNGNAPSLSSTVYSAPISVESSLTIKAIAVKSGMNDSLMSFSDYVITPIVYGNLISTTLNYEAVSFGMVRLRVFTSELTIPTDPVYFIKIEVTGNIDFLYVGKYKGSGNPYDASSLTQVTFGGNTYLYGTAHDEKTLSDAISFTWNKTDDLIISAAFDVNTENSGLGSVSWADTYYSENIELEPSVSAGYQHIPGTSYVVNRIVTDGF